MRVRCQCGRIGSTLRACKVCGSDHPMRHWHGEEPHDPSKEHAHPHNGLGHDHCPHPEDQRRPTVLNHDDPNLAYCGACTCVIKLVNGEWVPDSVPGQITKVVTRRG